MITGKRSAASLRFLSGLNRIVMRTTVEYSSVTVERQGNARLVDWFLHSDLVFTFDEN